MQACAASGTPAPPLRRIRYQAAHGTWVQTAGSATGQGQHKRTQLQPTVATHLGADTTESGSYDALRTSTCDHDRAQIGHNPAPPLGYKTGTVLHARSCSQPARPLRSPGATAAPAVVCFSRGAHWLSLCLILMSAWRALTRRCASCSKPPPGPRRSAQACRRPAARRGTPAAGARG